MKASLWLTLGGSGLVLGLIFLTAPLVLAQAPSPVTVQIQGTGDPRTSGTAIFRSSGQQTGVDVTVNGLQPNTQHVLHVHSGTCEAEGGIIIPLPDLTANASGTATATATIDRPINQVATGQTYITVHAESVLPSPTIACGNIPVAAATGGQATAVPPTTAPSGGPRTGSVDPMGPLAVGLILVGLLSLVGGLALRQRAQG